jgi:hypothetical protein
MARVGERLVGAFMRLSKTTANKGNVIFLAVSVCLVGGFVAMMAWILR